MTIRGCDSLKNDLTTDFTNFTEKKLRAESLEQRAWNEEQGSKSDERQRRKTAVRLHAH